MAHDRLQNDIKRMRTLISLLLGFFLLQAVSAFSATIEAVGPKEAAALIAVHKDSPDFVILDIRTPAEFQNGHLPKALLVDYYSQDFQNRLEALDKDKVYLVYCRSGNRSGRALSLFNRLGFNHVYHMAGGINSWIEAGFPLVR